jgi:hypothetical protein
MNQKDRQFLRIPKRDDMRVTLAAEMGRFGYEKKQILEMDEEVAAGRAERAYHRRQPGTGSVAYGRRPLRQRDREGAVRSRARTHPLNC